MKHRLALAVAIALASAAAPALAHNSKPAPSAVNEQANPFFSESPLPLHYPQFDKIKDSDFAPAFDRGMYLPELPDVDVVVRTSGERRISNFMASACRCW